MQWYRDGGEVEVQYHEDEDRLKADDELPYWNWERVYYFPVPKPSYEERQAKWIEENNVKVGDKVKCLPFEDYQDGFQQNVSYAKLLFNEVAKIYSIDQHGISVVNEDNIWLFPYFSLELVKPQYKPYEKADPAWLVKTDEVVKKKEYEVFLPILRIEPTDNKYSVQVSGEGYYSVKDMFTNFEWYNIATGETRPFGEQI